MSILETIGVIVALWTAGSFIFGLFIAKPFKRAVHDAWLEQRISRKPRRQNEGTT